MRIESAQLALESQRSFLQQTTERVAVEAWTGPAPPTAPPADPEGVLVDLQSQLGELPDPAGRIGGLLPSPNTASATQAPDAADTCQAAERGGRCLDEFEAEILRKVLEKLTGQTFKVDTMQDPPAVRRAIPQPVHAQPAEPAVPDWGLRVEVHREHTEVESTSLNARAIVHTADGRQIDVAVELTFSRAFHQREDLLIEMGNAVKDPLVIHYDGPAPDLEETTFRFDIDADGQAEDLPTLSGGSGFLALDADGNGRIDDGTELFGPASGDGFSDLADHDADGNGWIDENDDVFRRLRIWRPDEQGGGELLALADVGVGAIGLARTNGEFDFRTGQDNRLLGKLRGSGLVLMEDGSAGTVHQIDLAV